MTSDELARIIGAMSERPWTTRWDPTSRTWLVEDLLEVVAECPDRESNHSAIVALANHADALVELVRACERLVAGTLFELRGVEVALSRVHAVAMEDKDA